jgi:hypothetical protein
VLAPKDASRAFAERASFLPQPGLSNARGITFAALGKPGIVVRLTDGGLALGTATRPADRASATFLVS